MKKSAKSRSGDSWGEDKGPESLGEVLSRLFTARGWGQRQGQLHLEKAWSEAVGQETATHTRINSFRRGVLEVLVDNAVLMSELASFRKRKLLDEVRRRLPNLTITDLRFRAGVIG